MSSQIIFSFWSFEISEGILRNQKCIIGLNSFHIFGSVLIIPVSLCIENPVEICKITVNHFGSISPNLKSP